MVKLKTSEELKKEYKERQKGLKDLKAEIKIAEDREHLAWLNQLSSVVETYAGRQLTSQDDLKQLEEQLTKEEQVCKIIEQYAGRQLTSQDDLNLLKSYLEGQENRGHYFSNALNPQPAATETAEEPFQAAEEPSYDQENLN